MPCSLFMTQTEVELLTTTSSPKFFLPNPLLLIHLQKEVQLAEAPRILLASLKINLPQEVPEESLDLASSSELWMTTIRGLLTSKSLPKLSKTTCLVFQTKKSDLCSTISMLIKVAHLTTMSSSEASEDP